MFETVIAVVIYVSAVIAVVIYISVWSWWGQRKQTWGGEKYQRDEAEHGRD